MSKQKLVSLLAIIILAAAGVYIFVYKDFKVSEPPQGAENSGAPALGENPVDKGDLTEEYISPDFGFSFKYPKDFSATELEDDMGATVVLQKSGARDPSTGSGNLGFQIYISEFDEEGPITPERIKQDLPDTVVNQPLQVLIGEKKDIPALIFLSKHESLGDVREVWFVSNGFLYQLTAYADMDNLIGPILETLRFQE